MKGFQTAIDGQLQSKSLSFKVWGICRECSKTEFSAQKSHYQQLADNGSKLAYLPSKVRLLTFTRFSAHQNSEIS